LCVLMFCTQMNMTFFILLWVYIQQRRRQLG
jgi:hypothetical protein